MIWISTTQSSAVFVTLREKATLPNPYYTWLITNRDSLELTVFAPENFSGSPYYDCFTISVGTPSFATGSNVVLNIVQGQYDYKVFETGTEYDLSMTGSVVETGILQVTGTATSIQQFTQSDDDTIKIFNYI